MCRSFVSSSLGLREINPRQRPPCRQAYGLYATPEAQQVYYQQTTNTHIRPITRPITHPSNLTSVHSPIHPFTHLIHSTPIHSSTQSIHPLHPFTHPSIIHPRIHQPIHPSISLIHPPHPSIH